MEINDLLDIAQGYRAQMPALLTHTSSEIIEEEISKRDVFKVQLREKSNELADKIAELEAQKRVISVASSYQSTDVKKLEALKWELIRSRPKQ
jgi:hypothetical protein